MLKQAECPACGSKKCLLTVNLKEIPCWIDEHGYVDFNPNVLKYFFEVDIKTNGAICSCNMCGKEWRYEAN